MPSIYETKNQMGEIWKSEDQEAILYSRDNIILISGQNLAAGTVLGRITASGKHTILAPAAGTGEAVAVGILLLDTDASLGDVKTVMGARDGMVPDNKIVWPAGITAGEKATAIAQLADVGIIVRAGV